MPFEDDPLVTPATGFDGGAVKGDAREEWKARGKGIGGWELRAATLSWLIFVLDIVLFSFALQEYETIAFVVAGLTVGLSSMFLVLGITEPRRDYIVTGFMCLVSVLMATLLGLYLSSDVMQEYWRLKRGATFDNVVPSEAAATHNDATKLKFAEGTFVDTSQTVGWMQGGNVYCVAPIASSGAPSLTVEYWAVGKNCCEERSAFGCGDSGNPAVRSGIVLASDASDDSAFRKAYYSGMGLWKSYSDAMSYRKAIAEAESVYNLKSSDGSLLLHWVQNLDAQQSDLWWSGVVLVLILVSLHLVFVTGAAIAVNQLIKQRRRKMPSSNP